MTDHLEARSVPDVFGIAIREVLPRLKQIYESHEARSAHETMIRQERRQAHALNVLKQQE